MQSVGIIIGRFNPLHIGHEFLINSCLKKTDKTIIILGSANIKDEKNPLDKAKRKNLINLVYKKQIEKKIIEIKEIDDFESDLEWILEVKNLLNPYLDDKLIFFGGDLKNDYAIKIINLYKNYFENKISFCEEKRTKLPISATQIREIIKNKDFEELEKWVNKEILDFLVKNKELFQK